MCIRDRVVAGPDREYEGEDDRLDEAHPEALQGEQERDVEGRYDLRRRANPAKAQLRPGLASAADLESSATSGLGCIV